MARGNGGGESSARPTIEHTDHQAARAPNPFSLPESRSLGSAMVRYVLQQSGSGPLWPTRSPRAPPSPMGVCPAAGKYISYCTVWEGHDLGNCRSPSLTPALLPPSNLLRTRPGRGRGKPVRLRALALGVCVCSGRRGDSGTACSGVQMQHPLTEVFIG